jgi:hypothetical protein
MIALLRNEEVTLLYRRRPCGVVVPLPRMPERQRITWHPFFGMFRRYGPKEPAPAERLDGLERITGLDAADRLCR